MQGVGESLLTVKIVKHYMEKESIRKYYVYEWFRCSDGHVFYVGKGSGNRIHRIRKSHRNRFFLNYINKYQCDSRIVKDNLTEKKAYILENDIYQKRKLVGECECNLADTSSCSGGATLKGPLNGMYGKTHSPEVREFLKAINSDGRNKGKNNSQYKVSPKERMDTETYNIWRKKQRARKDGHSNPNSHNVLMLNIKTKQYKIFEATVECADYILKNIPELSNRYSTREEVRYMIKHANKNQLTYKGWGFVIYNKKTPINVDDTVSSFTGKECIIKKHKTVKKM